MSKHDQTRLFRAISTTTKSEYASLAELNRAISDVGDAIRGLQSTDDPDPLYAEEEDRLQKEYKRLEKLRDKFATQATCLPPLDDDDESFYPYEFDGDSD